MQWTVQAAIVNTAMHNTQLVFEYDKSDDDGFWGGS